MKKLLLTVIASLALCGSIFAQYESHWGDIFDEYTNNPYEYQGGLVAFIQINGDFIGVDDNWAAIEVAAFVGDQCRGHAFMLDETYLGDPYPSLQMSIYCNLDAVGDTVTFVMFDHSTGIEYADYTCNYEILTGADHFEAWDDPDTAVVLSFTDGGTPEPQTFTKDITGYGEGIGNWYLIASPIGDVAPGDVENLIQEGSDDDFDLFYYDQTQEDAEWVNYKEEDGGFNADFGDLMTGKGYLYASKEDVTLSFTGTPVDGDSYEVSLDYDADYIWTDGENSYYWNLVGNPFAETAYLDRDFYVMNEDGTDIMTDSQSGSVEPMEGVFVLVNPDDANVTFTTEEPGKSASLSINLSSSSNVIDRAVVRFGEGRTLPKFQLNRNSTKVYIPMDGEDYAVVRSEGMGEMPVNFKAESNGSYTLGFANEAVSFNYLHLIDNMTGADVDLLANPSYTFNALTTDYASRFRLVFATGNAAEDSFAFMSNGNLIVSNDGEAALQVVDVNGRILKSESINGSAAVSVNAAAGVYTLRLVNGNDVKVQKIVIR